MEIKTEKGIVYIPDYRKTSGLLNLKQVENFHKWNGGEMEIKTEKGTVFIPDYRKTSGLLDIKRMERIHKYFIKETIWELNKKQ